MPNNMAYEKQNWKGLPDTSTPITPERLNHIEDGISEIDTKINEINNNIVKLIETGSNENGEYIKFSNGIMICTIKKSGNTPINSSWGTGFNCPEPISMPDFPQPFVEVPYISAALQGGYGALIGTSNLYSATNTNPGSFSIFRPSSSNSQDYIITIIAIGRWK